MNHPDRIRVGTSVILWDVEAAARLFGVTTEAMQSILDQFHVPILTFTDNPKKYFSQYALEIALFQLGLPAALKGERHKLLAHQEVAGLLYGAATKEAIVLHVKELAKSIHSGDLTKKRRRATITRPKRVRKPAKEKE